MTNFIERLIIGKNPDYDDLVVRTKLGTGTGIVGIILNLILAALKAGIGFLSGSISIVADALNNLTDTAASVVSVFGIYLSGKPSDEEHPYGHGRGEYIATLIVAFIIFFVGITLLKSSVENIINPTAVEFRWVTFFVLLLSIITKFWMYKFQGKIGKKIDSSPLEASSLDSLGDVLVTFVVALSFVLSNFINFPIDGVGGVFVAIFILKAGYDLINEMISELLGESVDPKLEEEIIDIFKFHEEILDTHDFYVHHYGHGKDYATIDAVVRPDVDITEIHDIFTEIEHDVFDKFNLRLSIHMDLLKTESSGDRKLIKLLDKYIKNDDVAISYHDEAIIESEGETHILVHLITHGSQIKTNDDEIKEIKKLKDFLRPTFGDVDYDIIIDKVYH